MRRKKGTKISASIFTPFSADRKYLKDQRHLVMFSTVSHNIFPHHILSLKNTESPVLTYHTFFIRHEVDPNALQILQCERLWQRKQSDEFLHRFLFRGLKTVWLLCYEDGQQSGLPCDYIALTAVLSSDGALCRGMRGTERSFCRPSGTADTAGQWTAGTDCIRSQAGRFHRRQGVCQQRGTDPSLWMETERSFVRIGEDCLKFNPEAIAKE